MVVYLDFLSSIDAFNKELISEFFFKTPFYQLVTLPTWWILIHSPFPLWLIATGSQPASCLLTLEVSVSISDPVATSFNDRNQHLKMDQWYRVIRNVAQLNENKWSINQTIFSSFVGLENITESISTPQKLQKFVHILSRYTLATNRKECF